MMALNGRVSLTLRLTLLFASVSTTVLLLLGLLIAALVEQHFEELDMELLGGKLEYLRHALQQVSSSEDLEALPGRLQDSLVGNHGLAVVIVAPDGQPVFASGAAEFPAALLSAGARQSTAPALWSNSKQQRFRGFSAEARTGIHGAPPAVVGIATDIAHHEHFMRSFQIALWSVVGSAALLTGILGWIAARRGLAPLQEISARAAGITADRLDHRLSIATIPAELAEVAGTLNDMLARLEESFRRLSDFSSDIAHELRTPVSNLLTQTQVMLSRPRTTGEYQDVLASNAEELERLSRMIADMLFLAKSDHKLIVPHREKVDLSAEIQGLLEFYEALIEEKRIQISQSGNASVSGDKLMLRRAASNLLSNAIRHTPVGGHIVVRLAEAGERTISLAFENTGETIPAEHLPRLFDRFYRVGASRQGFGEGAGLGLAMTRSIARAHGGEALVRSENGLTTFELRLPV